MAPRRGGGSGGGGLSGASASCPHPFSDDSDIISTPIPYFVSYCIFFLVTLFILIGWSRVKKHHPTAKKLVGGIYGLSLFFQLLGYALQIIATMLRECGTTAYWTYYDWAIAFVIFFRLAGFLQLVVVLWGVNSLLRAHLGSTPAYLKIVCGVVLGILGAICAAFIGLSCFNLYVATGDGGYSYSDSLYDEENKLGLAYYVLYLAGVVIAGSLSMITIIELRSRQLAGDLLGWIVALSLSMFIWTLFIVIEDGAALANNYLGLTVYEAFEFIIDFFQSLAWIILLMIAKSRAFKSPLVDNNNNDNGDFNAYAQPGYSQGPVYPPQGGPNGHGFGGYHQQGQPQMGQPQYGFANGNGTGVHGNANANQQQQFYNYQQQQQQPIYASTPSPVNGQNHVTYVK